MPQEKADLQLRVGLPEKPTHVIGIGASAGGLKALQLFFSNMPKVTGLAFVIVQHLSPDYKSMMVELLGKTTSISVCRAEDGMVMAPDHIYLIPPRKNITTLNGSLFLAEQRERQGLNLPIDIFLRSLAEDQAERSIGIILSGTGSDGTRGLRAIKAEGGTIFVQDEASAEFNGMPRCAIATGLADFILPPEKMAEQLLKFINHPRICLPKAPMEVIEKEEDSFTKLVSILRKETKVDFTFYKPATVIRRIERRMGLVQVPELDQYLTYVHRNPDEIKSLFKDLLIGVTKFFRNQQAFKAVSDNAVPAVVEMAQKRAHPQIRVWVVGCSTGEEAYSIAMAIQAGLEAAGHSKVETKIFATDIDKKAIETAGLGVYPESIAADVDVDYLSRYFEKIPGGYRVKKSIRQMVIFAVHNVIDDPPFTKIDLIVCRNLLIYLQQVLQKKIFQTFNYILRQGGYLFLGNSETLLAVEDCFEDVDAKHRLYKHKVHGANFPPPGIHQQPHSDFDFSAARIAYENHPEITAVKRKEAKEKYYQNLISNMVGILIVINEMREVVQSFGDTKQYISLPQGNVSLDVLTMLPREISLAVSSAIQRVRKEKQKIHYSNIKIPGEQGEQRVNLTVNTLVDYSKEKNVLYMIQIDEIEEKNDQMPLLETSAKDQLTQEHISDLEREILFTRENLQATIEELQTTNEELQATNEELLAANEELQSTNEELQSVNEELNTVNAEYQNKVLELTELNADMDNLMTSSDIPTVFLDKNLCIRKFSSTMPPGINLLPQDIGRPFSDLNLPTFKDLDNDAQMVLTSGHPVEKNIKYKDNWYYQRILPFIDKEKNIEGLVLTLVKITAQKLAEIKQEKQQELLLSIMDYFPSAMLLTQADGKITFANQHAQSTLGIKRSRLLRMKITSPKIRFTDLDGNLVKTSEHPFTLICEKAAPVKQHILRLEKSAGESVVLNINAKPVLDDKNRVDGAVFRMDQIAYV